MIRKVLKKSWSFLNSPINLYVERYGDLIYDLCMGILANPAEAQIAFRRVLKKLRSEARTQSFCRYEKAWVLRLTTQVLLELHEERKQSSFTQEQFQLDSEVQLEKRLDHFFYYFHRLPVESQILLFLKDKHQVSYPDLSMALNIPEGSLRLQYQQSLSLLEGWLWKTP